MRRTQTPRTSFTLATPRWRALELGGPLVAWLVAAVLVLVLTAGATSEGSAEPFRVGFSRSLFTEVNDADAKASIKAWAQTVARERDINMNPSAQLYEHTEEMVEAMTQGLVDALSLTFEEYIVVSRRVPTSHWFVTETAGSLFEEYIVLVHADGGISDLQALEGHAILFHETARTGLAMDWLDHLTISDGHNEGAAGFFGPISNVSKVSAAVLPVFFGKADATVVAASNFRMMCELNPQLGHKLRIIAKSRPLVPAILCFRKDFESPEKERVMTALRELHTTPAGEQVLTIFQSQALVLVDDGPLRETTAFMEETDRLRLKARKDTASQSPGNTGGSRR